METEIEQIIISDGKLIVDIDGVKHAFGLEEIVSIVKRKTYNISNTKADRKTMFESLLEDIDEHYDIYDFDRAVAFLGMSRSHFSRYFHKQAGLPFFEFLNRTRIAKSIEMIKTDNMLIRDIAIKCGFNNTRNFHRVFKEYTGCNPSEMPKDFIFTDI